MPARQKLTLEGLVVFAVAGVAFGLLYNTLFYPHTLVEYAEAAVIGLLLGLAAGIAEHTFLGPRLRGRSFIQAVLVRTLVYATFVAVALSIVLAVEPAALGECSYFGCLAALLAGPQFLRDLVFSTVFAFLTMFSVHIVLLVGTRNFARLVFGKYRRPRELYAVFMFVDLRDSTSIAERLGHVRFSAFLSEFFNELSDPIHGAKGEVYQYVGDEVVVVWPGERRARGPQWLECYEAMQASVAAAVPSFSERYGCAPEFKAGAHCGHVMVTEVGTLQRAHVYHGDILNTAARIRDFCNESGFNLLVSEALAATLAPARHAEFERIASLQLRGKEEEVVLFGYRSSARRVGHEVGASA
jgi:adenylate cyclase